ncbi:MAG: putative glycosyltransferase EpsD [Alphaproteobacteria bacterium MarineAlpha11_Bin1]|nr:MAG: putative glycosyltransferase EpsD [Alphaproteobacteria bacterium MarineAlpha11_Bin1]|tara:strand:+ start:3816 stop:4856 length:1041 start_codon:yes stop_codon:yes gene_type:complete
MKIMQTMAGGPIGGAEEFFVRLASAFQARGVEQTVVIRPNHTRDAQLRGSGVNPIELPFGRILDFRTVSSLAEELDRVKPDVVLSWMNRASEMTGRARLRARSKSIQIGRQGGYYDLKYYRNCDHLIGNTPDIVQYITDNGWPSHRAHYVPNFVHADPGFMLPRSQFNIPIDTPLMLAAGRLHQNKAFDILLQAMTYAEGVHLLVAGEGPDEHKLKRLVQKLDLTQRVRFLGWRLDIADLIATADFLVCPSRKEPLGNIIVEAWAGHLPVVATASEGPGWLITDGEDGLLVPIDDDCALASAISRIADDRDLATRLAAAGYKRFEEEFTEASVVKRFLELFDKVSD